jgi:hypothetical protein
MPATSGSESLYKAQHTSEVYNEYSHCEIHH